MAYEGKEVHEMKKEETIKHCYEHCEELRGKKERLIAILAEAKSIIEEMDDYFEERYLQKWDSVPLDEVGVYKGLKIFQANGIKTLGDLLRIPCRKARQIDGIGCKTIRDWQHFLEVYYKIEWE